MGFGSRLGSLALVAALTAAPILASGAASVPAAAQAQRSGTSDLDDWLKVAAAQVALAAARSVADITFETSTVSPDNGGVVLTGVSIRTTDFDGRPRGCEVEIARAEIAFDVVSLATFGDALLRGRDVSASLSCLPPQGRLVAVAVDRLRFDDLLLRTAYDLPSGGLDYTLRLDAPGLAEIAAEGRLDYVNVRVAGDAGSPSVKFGPATVSLVDYGTVRNAALLFGGADAAAAEAARFVRRRLGRPGLAERVEREVARFLDEGGRLSVSIDPTDDAWLDRMERMDPADVAAVLRPGVGAAPPARVAPRPLLRALAGDPSPDQRLEAARAMIDGAGMPRNPRRAVALLEPLAGSGESAADAKALLARALLADGTDLSRAYRTALDAGAGGASVRALLDRLEARLDPRTVRTAQAEALERWPGRDTNRAARGAAMDEGDTLALLRDARLYAEGEGRPRHFGEALTLAALAEAAGEIGAGGLVREMERRTAPPAFAAMRQAARDEATNLWIGRLGPRLAEREAAAPPIDYGSAEATPSEPEVVPSEPEVVPTPSEDDVIVVPGD